MTERFKTTIKGAELRALSLKRDEYHSSYFQKDRDTIEKRSELWLKELAHQSQTRGSI